MANVISIARARKVSGKLARHTTPNEALKRFAATGEVLAGLMQSVRRLEAAKAALWGRKTISQQDYWDIVDLERFMNWHADAGFTELRASAAKSAVAEGVAV